MFEMIATLGFSAGSPSFVELTPSISGGSGGDP